MEDEEQGRADQAVLDDLLKEVPLTQSLASEPISVVVASLPQFLMTTPEISLVQSAPVSTINLNVNEERIPISTVQTNVQINKWVKPVLEGSSLQGEIFQNS